MAEETTERKVLHGLRHRPTGAMLRVREVVTRLQDEPYLNEDTTFHLTLDAEHPLFDAGTPMALSRVLAPTSGGSRTHPRHDGFAPDDLQPVVMVETVTRTIRPADVAMEVPVRIDPSNIYDVRQSMAKGIPGLGEILEMVAAHKAGLEAVIGPDGEYGWGGYSVVAYAIPVHASEMPEGIVGEMVVPLRSESGGRRALGVLELHGNQTRWAARRGLDEPEAACFLVCLSDSRPLPDGLLEALVPATAPAPR